MLTDVADLAAVLKELGQPGAANRIKGKGMPITIYHSPQYQAAYTDKLKMYTKVKESWLIKDDNVSFSWVH